MFNIILSIDDEAINHDIVQEVLPYHKIECAMSAKEALEILQVKDIDLILLDIVMPDYDGLKLCKEIKNNPKTSHIPILFITANTNDTFIKEAFEAGGIDFIKKPINAVDLQQRVKLHLKDKVIFTIDKEYYFNLKTVTLYKENTELLLSTKEKELLSLFISKNGITLEAVDIANYLDKEYNKEYKSKTIRNLVSSLRGKLPKGIIENIYGVGYLFKVS